MKYLVSKTFFIFIFGILSSSVYSSDLHNENTNQHIIVLEKEKDILNTPIKQLNDLQQNAIKILIAENFLKNLQQYQSLGLYNLVKDIHFNINFDSGENYYDGINTIYMDIDSNSSFNHLLLDKKHSFGFDLIKVLNHELAHIQFFNNYTLIDDNNDENIKILNQHIRTDFSLSENGRTNTVFAYVQENFADTYGEFTYLKQNHFNEESILSLQNDIKLRTDFNHFVTNKLGVNSDPHDTINSLHVLLYLVVNHKENLDKLNPNNSEKLIKAIVFNSYKKYLESDSVKNDIQYNLSHKKYLKEEENYYKTLIMPDYINIMEIIKG